MTILVKASECKIHALSDFNGNHAKASTFFTICQVSLHLNKDPYPNNESRIIFVLLYMVEGAAGAYKEAIYTHVFTINLATSQENGFGTWIDFVKKFNEAFTPLNLVNNAITFIKALKQTGTADNHVAAF